MRSVSGIRLSLAFAFLALFLSCKDEIIVVVPVATVEVQGPGEVPVGASAQFTAVPRDERGNALGMRSVSWSVSNGTVASVAQGGMLQGEAGGTVTVTASCEGRTGTASLTVNNPVPLVTATEPTVVTVGSGPFLLRVLGTGFVSTSVVRWNGADRTTTFVSGMEVRTAITEADVAVVGAAQVAVFNPAPGGGISDNRALTVGNPVPAATTASPDHVTMGSANLTVTVTGTGFVAASKVRWNGEDRTTTYVSGTELRATILAADLAVPGWKALTVSNPSPGGGESQGKAFAVRIPATGPFAAAGYHHSCALTPSGQAYCWGSSAYGQLGNGSTIHQDLPVAVAGGLKLVALTAGLNHTCGLDQVGLAYCWGNGWAGQLGEGATTSRNQPVAVSGGLSFMEISGGDSHTCGVTHDGRAYCWGWNEYGQLGVGPTTNESRPVPVEQGAATFRSISAGTIHTCATTEQGAVRCWGHNYYGQLGDGSTTNRSAPVPVSGLTGVAGVASGGYHTCAWTASGPVYCWGSGHDGQLGNGSFTLSPTPVTVSSLSRLNGMSGGAYHSCGIESGGEVRCWGASSYGQLGYGGWSVSEGKPVLVSGLYDVVSLAAGYHHTCAITAGGEGHCWGDQGFGQLGVGKTAFRSSPTPVVSGPTAFGALSAGDGFTCGASSAGEPYCWGRNENGELGNGLTQPSATPVKVSTSERFAYMGSGARHSCGLTVAGQAHCWGFGGWGNLGNGSYDIARVPQPVAGGHSFVSLGVGEMHTCGVDAKGQVLCWGQNYYGQIGDGSISSRSLPTPALSPPGLTFRMVATGGLHSCAAALDGTVYCWGYNPYGQLGDGTTTHNSAPVQVSGLSGVVSLSLGSNHSCALDAAGMAYCWGVGWNGTLGRGSDWTHSSVPVPVSGGLRFGSLHANSFYTCGVTTENRGYCWGLNAWGQVGDGTMTTRSVPVEIAGGHSWSVLHEGNGMVHTCGIADGWVYCWGRQRAGELGIDEWGVEIQPVLVQGGVSFQPPTGSGAWARRGGTGP